MRGAVLFFLVMSTQAALPQGLKDYYESYFPIGASVSLQTLTGDEAALVRQQFNSLTAENVMKMGPIHPIENGYDWEAADKIVAFAQANNMKVRGHCLLWHKQMPDWFLKDKNGKEVSKEVLLSRIRNHIQAIVSRYKGKVYAWDVVNEVINDDTVANHPLFRDSQLMRIGGFDCIKEAFIAAQEADSGALLFYNDYNIESGIRHKRTMVMINMLTIRGIRVDGIGIQGHWNIYNTDPAKVAFAIEDFAKHHLQVQITELDLSIYRHNSDAQASLTADIEQKQADVYKALFEVFRDHQKAITGVTFWNLSDRHSWLDNFPVRGRKNYPLLFDEQLKAKKAYWEVAKF
jgi:endo-1,4-beta-xylanase